MKAWVLRDIGQFQMEDVAMPKMKPGEVLVKVRAVGICGSDVPRVYTTGAYSYPLIPGHEFAGEVFACGTGVSEKWKGKRVGVFPLIPCKECNLCKSDLFEMCRNYSYLGSRRDGGFAEYVAVPEWNLIELPENVSFEEGAMLEPMSVAVHAMRRCMPMAQDTVVVYGLGTIGLLLIMFLKEAGAGRILAIGNKEAQKSRVVELGLSEEDYCDSSSEDVRAWVSRKTAGVGAEVCFECIGKSDTVADVIAFTAPGGKVMLVGNPYSDIMLEQSVYWKVLRNQLTVLGTWNSSFLGKESDDWHYVIKRLAEGSIHPEKLVTHCLPLEDIGKGILMIKEKTEDYVKVMAVEG